MEALRLFASFYSSRKPEELAPPLSAWKISERVLQRALRWPEASGSPLAMALVNDPKVVFSMNRPRLDPQVRRENL